MKKKINTFNYFFCAYICHKIYLSVQYKYIQMVDITTNIQTKKDKDRRKGKGRRCCLGGRIYSIPCRTSYFALDDFEE